MRRMLKRFFVFLIAIFLLPLSVHGTIAWSKGWPANWHQADWSSAGILPRAKDFRQATIRVYAARAARWRGVFAVHSWIIVKRKGARSFKRYEVLGWGRPVRLNAYAPDGKWYSNPPKLVYALNGAKAQKLIAKVEKAIAHYPYADHGDYRIWPGPNSNSFVAHVLAQVPELDAQLPPHAIGKDFPVNNSWVGLTPSRTGIRFTLGGYVGLKLGWIEGLEINFFGLVAGIDIRRPALKLPGFGRIEWG